MTVIAKAKGLELRATKTTIKGQTTQKGELYIYGDIVSEKWFDDETSPQEVIDLLNEMSGLAVQDIDVFINSPGGSVFSGVAIYSALKRHPAAINVQIDGLAASIASVIAQAGDLISISDAGMMMIHSPWSAVVGNAEEMRKQANVLDKVEDSMIGAYARSGIEEPTLRKMLAEETWLSAQDAVDVGLADEIVQVTDVAAALVPKERFKNTPQHLLLPIRPPEPVNSIISGNTNDNGGSPMPEPTNIDEKLKAVQESAAKEAREQAIAEENERKARINGIFKKFPQHSDLRSQCIEDSDCSFQMASDKLFDALAGDGPEPLGGATRIQDLGSERDKFRAGVINGALQRCGVITEKDDPNNPYRGFSMRDVARVCVQNMGQPVDKMGTEQIIKAALTSESDFPVLYENVMHKVLLNAYRIQPDTWSSFLASGQLSDFRPHNRYRLGTFGDLPTLAENGEIKRTNLQDATKEQIAAEERGMIFDMSFKAIVDDDLGGLTNIAAQMGRSARRTVENNAYAELVSNPVMGDGTPLFHADHNNLEGTGSAISIASLGKARATMRRHKDPSSNEYIDIMPSILLCPVELGDSARQVLQSETDITKANSKARNPVQNMVTVVDTPRLTGTGWYLFAAPSDVAVGEVGFLNGNTEPQMMMENLFSTRGVQWRVTLDFGIAMLEWRAGYYNPGA
jgi:ATP-dependent Clp endopeptidase proteolytic subunit ClpP